MIHSSAGGALRTSYPTPSAGTFTVHRNIGGAVHLVLDGKVLVVVVPVVLEVILVLLLEFKDFLEDPLKQVMVVLDTMLLPMLPWMTTAGGESGYFGAGGGGRWSDPAPNGTGGQKGLGGGGVGDGQNTSA